MALNFQPYQDRAGEETRARWSRSLDDIYNAYQQAKVSGRQDQAAALQAELVKQQLASGQRTAAASNFQETAKFDAPLSTFSPQDIQQAAVQAKPSFTGPINPKYAKMAQEIHSIGEQSRMALDEKRLGMDKTRSEITENEARALRDRTLAGQAAKAPTGFRSTQSGDGLEPIPGGPADIKLAEQNQKKELASSNLAYNAERMISKIDELVPRIGMATTGVGSLTGGIPATPAKNFAEDLKTLQANIGFQALNAMREASKTGGALGQVSERELAFLQATVAALDPAQGSDQLRKNLMEVRNSFLRTLETARSGGVAPQGRGSTSAPKSDPLGLFK